MTSRARRSRTAPVAVAVAVVSLTAATAGASAAGGESRPLRVHAIGVTATSLDLGPTDLPETRSTVAVQPGVRLTRIDRGGSDSGLFWTLETLIPAGGSSPDPDAPPQSISDRASAAALAAQLRANGFDPRVEAVRQPAVADVRAGVLGYRVRVGRFTDQAAADRAKADLTAAGESATSVYTGWDGDRTARGPWHVNVVTIDPRRFRGTLAGSFGPDLFDRETTSALSQASGATVGVNGGYFVLDPASGAPGDPAGVGVYDGRLLSEPIAQRPALVLHDDARATRVSRFTWQGWATLSGRRLRLDGIDRVPGLIRNCGGDSTDQPTSRPVHDTTCTDDSELVAFTPEFDDRTPSGPGREIVLDRHRVVRAVLTQRGTSLPPRWMSIQGTGALADRLAGVAIGDRVGVRTRPVSAGARLTPDTTVVNGGPLLVRHGRERITQRQDGFVHAGDPSFAYGFVIKRNPRTFAGVDARGRTVLVTVDGRSTSDLGLSIPEEADVSRSLGLVDAVNLDGGGSTTMTLHGQVITHPSDATGERPVGDAILVLPGVRG
jgi:phosphodiester glycosidase/sporulation related protein